MGSKRALLEVLLTRIQGLSGTRVLDGFAGTTRVSQALRQAGYVVHCNDVSDLSVLFGRVYIANTPNESEKQEIQAWIKKLNTVPGKNGFIADNYGAPISSPILEGKKRPYWIVNAAKADAIRTEIEGIDNTVVKNALLVSLILAMDKVENTLGHQVAYLKEWASRALQPLWMECPSFVYGPSGEVTQGRAEDVAGEFDIAYFDPPYGTNNERYPQTRVRYASYYHLWRTLIQYNAPVLVGKSLRPADLSDRNDGVLSNYESTDYHTVYKAFEKLYGNSNARSIVCSYSNKSKLKVEDLIGIAKQYGSVEVEATEYKENVQKKLVTTSAYLGDQEKNIEYLVILKR